METCYDDAILLSSKDNDFCSCESDDSMSSHENPTFVKVLLRGMKNMKM
jgi:hypothetical protein